MPSAQKFKIEIILRSSPPRPPSSQPRTAKISKKDLYLQGVLYGRSASCSAPLPSAHNEQDRHIDLRQQISRQKQCLLRPSSKKQRQSRMFTEKCLEILNRKKRTKDGGMGSRDHHLKMQAMMHNVVDKYRRVINQNKSESLALTNFTESQITNPTTKTGCSQVLGYDEKVEVYRLIKSTQLRDISKEAQKNNSKQAQWRTKPDVTGVRVNDQILRSHIQDFAGVQCFSLPINQWPFTKRGSFFFEKSGFAAPQQTRTESSNSCRRKVSISKAATHRFMAFSLGADPDALYMRKLKSFLDFLFKVNYSNRLYISLKLSEDTSNIKKYKVYIGGGNNCLLIRSLLKRRFWLEIVDNPDDEGINFYWSQNKINKAHYRQQVSANTVHHKQVKQAVKRREPKDPEQKQALEMNRKILSTEQSYNVEQLVSKDGFFVSYSQLERPAYSVVTNHLPMNSSIGSKKNLFKSLYYYYKNYVKTDPFDYIPLTYSVRSPEDPEFRSFLKQHEAEPRRVWIVKPGQNSNRGNGIKLVQTCHLAEAIRRKQKHQSGQAKTYIIQSYIERPFLYNGRKFDIRHYMMLTSVNGILKCYWYKEGYIRTSSEKYDLEDLQNEQVHLTNDAIQKKYEQYQKHEPGNKVSYGEFQRYLDQNYPGRGYSFERDIVAKMKGIILDVVKANCDIIDKSRRESNFEIFGFDFMVDRDFKPWLIEINFNPCLEINCPVLARIIPAMVENSLRLGLDPLLPPANHYPPGRKFSLSDNFLKNLKYQLIFDELAFSQAVPHLFDPEDSDEEEQYADQGKEIDQLII